MTNNRIDSGGMEYEYVVKRNGSQEKVYFDKINNRLEKLCENLSINSTRVTRNITQKMYNGILTRENGNIFSELKKKIKSFGYRFEVFNLDAVNYGVPQYRKRVFVIGTKLNKYKISKPNITHGDSLFLEKENTINSVIGDLAKIKIDESMNHVPLKHKPKNLKRYSLIPEGGRLPENKLSKEL